MRVPYSDCHNPIGSTAPGSRDGDLHRDVGISLAFVKLAAKQEGTRVIIADLRLNDEATEFLKQARNVVFARCDVAVWPDLQNLIQVSEKTFGDVPDVYVAGAGVFEPVCVPLQSTVRRLAYTVAVILLIKYHCRAGQISGTIRKMSAIGLSTSTSIMC